MESTQVLTPDYAVIALAVSCDGVRFSPLAVLADTKSAGEGRTVDHPADGVLVDAANETALFFVHRNVPGIAPYTTDPERRSMLTRIPVALRTLADFTERHLPGGCPPPRTAAGRPP